MACPHTGLTFYWERDPSHPTRRWQLFDRRRGEYPRHPVGCCSRTSSGWRATVHGGAGRALPEPPFAMARSSVGAMRALEREAMRRSVGLWGVDDVTFERVGDPDAQSAPTVGDRRDDPSLDPNS